MKQLLDLLKLIAMCAVITVLAIVTYTFVQVHIEDSKKVYVGERRVKLSLMNYKREKCEVEEVDTVGPSGVTLRYKCGKTTIYATQRHEELEVEIPSLAKPN